MGEQLKAVLASEEATFDLDELVHEAAASMASSANNSGVDGQVAFLLQAGWREIDIQNRLNDARA